MNVIRNNKRAEQFWEFLREDFTKPRALTPDKVHVSELLAPRKAYWTRLLGERVTDEMIGLFATGEAFHLMFQRAAGMEFAEREVSLRPKGVVVGVVGHQDIVPPDGETTEVKTSRKWTVPTDPEPRYIDQITAYMAMEDLPVGHVMVLYLTAGRRWNGTKPSALELVSWQVELTADERADIRKQLLLEADRLMKAVTARKPLEVDLCPEWQCANIYKGEVQSVCPFYEDCQPEGRYPLVVLAGEPKPPAPKKGPRGKQASRQAEPAGSQKRDSRVLR